MIEFEFIQDAVANLHEHKKLCRAKGFSMGIILMPYYKKAP
jgi:hypothetical protein